HGFQIPWSRTSKSQDHNTTRGFIGVNFFGFLLLKSVKPVETDKDKTLLKQAVQEHMKNRHVYDVSREIMFIDDLVEGTNDSIESISVYHYSNEIQESRIPFYCWSSWLDGGYGDALLSRFMTFSNPQIAILGDWNHGALKNANPYHHSKKNLPKLKDMVAEWIHFFDDCLEGKGPKDMVLYYYTVGEERWKRTKTWPIPGQVMQKLYFRENNSLSAEEPTRDDDSAMDKYPINFKATTGVNNRWHAALGNPIKYKNRKLEDEKLLVYMSQPLEEDMEITGYPVIHLWMKSTHDDGMIICYLEDIDERGQIHYLTEGVLRLIHRKVSSEKPPYKIVVPYHSFKKKDYMPMVPGQLANIDFGLLPISALVKKSHRLRVAIAGADKDTFPRIPEDGNPVIHVSRCRSNPSYIELPVIPRK
ncbi:MAG: CocE/NonD family hydrolase, partial [Promethearchaeota archaeon]